MTKDGTIHQTGMALRKTTKQALPNDGLSYWNKVISIMVDRRNF
jgi:hypothetical protein